ncbi:MaoC family dehydratase [Arthrobacter sp. I2-34]|uniref:MaoC family dehydratase n=1 Tax=Arthrobacter hankyongi TaxID=2904801 RepID=A0ABS9L8W6_9MICC|nr:MaoC family dehydratase [Arthrobacter hankyongi]MCG2623119.1 MaoC family dehydratase [Arthrobacter hankyongi]
MRIFNGIDDFAQCVGEEIGVTEWRTITQDDIDAFAKVTNDHQWIHVDTERAASGPFGTTLVHGYMTLALVSGFLFDTYRIDGLSMGVNYGSNKVRYPAPVLVGSSVRGRIRLVSVDREDKWAQSTVQVTVEQELNGEAKKPGCVAEVVSRLYKAPAA